MADNKIRDGIRKALEPVGGTIQDLAIERRQWLSTLVAGRSTLTIRLIDGGVVTGTYMSHDEKTVVVSNSIYTTPVRFMEIDGIDQLV